MSELLGTVTVLLEYAAEVTELVIHDLYGHLVLYASVYLVTWTWRSLNFEMN